MNEHTNHLNKIEKDLLLRWDKAHFAWVRHIVTLSASGLTLLVGLKNNYIPLNPQYVFLIQLCWASLAASIASGLLVLFGASQSLLDAANHIKAQRAEHGDQQTALSTIDSIGYKPRPIFRKAFHVMVFFFLVSLLSLCVFATVNV